MTMTVTLKRRRMSREKLWDQVRRKHYRREAEAAGEQPPFGDGHHQTSSMPSTFDAELFPFHSDSFFQDLDSNDKMKKGDVQRHAAQNKKIPTELAPYLLTAQPEPEQIDLQSPVAYSNGKQGGNRESMIATFLAEQDDGNEFFPWTVLDSRGAHSEKQVKREVASRGVVGHISTARSDAMSSTADNSSTYSNDSNSNKELSREEKNRLACKRFRRRRKEQTQNLVEQNRQLEEERSLLLRRISQLQHELDSLTSSRFRDDQLLNENNLIKLQLNDLKGFVEQIVAAQVKVPDTRSIDTTRVLSVESRSAAQRFLALAAKSANLSNQDWVHKAPSQRKDGLGQMQYCVQALPFVAGMDLPRSRTSVRVEFKGVPIQPDVAYDRLWTSFHPQSHVRSFACDNAVHGAKTLDGNGNPLIYASLRQNQLDVEDDLLRWGFGTACPGTEVKLCVQSSVSPALLGDSGLLDGSPLSNESFSFESCLFGALVRPSTANPHHSDITIIESVPLGQPFVYRPSVLSEEDEISDEYLDYLNRALFSN